MRAVRLGEGEPELAIVGGIHGDEPCGVRAIDRLLAEQLQVSRPVTLVVANEAALDREVRFIDTDLNRSFDDETPHPAHERELAAQLHEEIRGTTTLSIHSTHSYAEPFAISSGVGPEVEAIVPKLSVDALVDAGPAVDGRLFEAEATIIEVEAGLQGSTRAAENAYQLAREFLTATGALSGEAIASPVPRFQLGRPIEKPPATSYEVFAENFVRVSPGEAIAAADDRPVRATEPFWPVLLSAYGYRDIFGYQSERAEPLAPG